MRTITRLSAAALALIAAGGAAADLRSLPVNGSGHVMVTRLSGSRSAVRLLHALVAQAGSVFSGGVRLTDAYVNDGDTDVQAAFVGKYHSVVMRGIATVGVRGQGGVGTLLFDRPASLMRSLPHLKAALGGGGGGVQAIHLTPTPLPDGSGQVSLPSGFRITGAYQGTVDIVGPHGEQMALGAVNPVVTPDVAGLYLQSAPVDFNDPVRAAMQNAVWMGNHYGNPMSPHVIDARYVPFQGHRAALIRYRMTDRAGVHEGFGLFAVMQTDQNFGILYGSYMIASPSVFNKSFPAMFKSWMSWGVSQQVLQSRLMEAAKTMRECGDTLTGIDRHRQEVYDHVNDAWDQVIRETWTYTGPNGTYTGVPNGAAPLMAAAGYSPVPIGSL